MWKITLLVVMLHSVSGLPVEDTGEQNLPDVKTTAANVEQLEKTVNVVSYIENFKNIMAGYVNTQHRNLTVHDMEKVKLTLEHFLINFANDLKQTIESQHKNFTFDKEREKIQDGVPDATFEEIKNRMKTEFPDVKDETADEIVFKLRKNLFVTRQKIDGIVNNSEKAEFTLG